MFGPEVNHPHNGFTMCLVEEAYTANEKNSFYQIASSSDEQRIPRNDAEGMDLF